MIDTKKQYRTRDGREVRIYAVDAGGDKPVHGAIANKGKWDFHCWSSLGDWASQECAATPLDLIEVRPRIVREVWVNVYPDEVDTELWHSKEVAEVQKFDGRIACVKLVIDCQEGEGL
jgi:hypothetical protein